MPDDLTPYLPLIPLLVAVLVAVAYLLRRPPPAPRDPPGIDAKLRTITVEPGQSLVILCDRPLTADQVGHIKAHAEACLGRSVLVLDEPFSVAVVKPTAGATP